MLRPLTIVLTLSLVLIASGTPLPLNTTEVALMLRAGYSNATVLRELAKRKFSDALNESNEAKLIQAGASPELLAALKTGSYAISSDEAAQVQQQRQNEAKHRAVVAEEASRFNKLYQAKLEQQRAADAVRQKINQGLVYQLVKGDLVQWHNGSMSRFDDAALESKKLFLIYFSAHWCQPCRAFTPDLVRYYNEMAAKHPEFDLIFVSRDKSPFGMEGYMRDANMPWPAIDYQKLAEKDGILKYQGDGIPDLVLVDGSGKVLADSYEGKKYVGPAKVLDALSEILTTGGAKNVAQAR
jgi:nucleoredoxin